MKTFRSKRGPFAERPFYEPEDVDSICLDALRETNLLPSAPAAIRIERFIEKRFAVVAKYDDLPNGVLGFTQFGPRGVEAVYVSRQLAETGTRGSERLLNSTFAHEAGHGLLHAHLFGLAAENLVLFDSLDVTETQILCRDERQPQRGYDGRWWEYQAQMAIGPLLMPRALVRPVVEPLLRSSGMLQMPLLPDRSRGAAISIVAETFDVNPAAARVRIGVMFPQQRNQLTL